MGLILPDGLLSGAVSGKDVQGGNTEGGRRRVAVKDGVN